MESSSHQLASSDHHPFSLPLHEFVKVSPIVKHRNYLKATLLLRSCLLSLFLLLYRLPTCLVQNTDGVYKGKNLLWIAFVCELWLSLQAHLSLVVRWSLVERVTHTSRLVSMLHGLGELPPSVDVFVTTCDPILEPPLITINTMLSGLALDYPSCRLACYVGDDGGSILTLWAIKQASSFARDWVPFCRCFDIVGPRAPGPHFALSTSEADAKSRGFYDVWIAMKAKYEELEFRVTSMTEMYNDQNSKQIAIGMLIANLRATLKDKVNSHQLAMYESWATNVDDMRHHESYCEVLIDKEEEGIPPLIYLCRQKHLKSKHYYKAGNMNALIRVSSIFTNAPFIMNLDCDMYVNDAKALLHAMCFFMDPSITTRLAYVQFPQAFEGIDSNNSTVANVMKIAMEVLFKGFDGAQGPIYCGTCCIHKREALHGKTIDDVPQNVFTSKSLENPITYANVFNKKSQDHIILQQSDFVEEAIKLISCTYEDGTNWGNDVGLIYGSTTEDVITSLKIQGKGWKSIFISPKTPAFLGCAPITSEDAFETKKRWATGFLEILVGANSPFSFTKNPRLTMIQRVNYMFICNYSAVSIPLTIYAMLPCASLLTRRPLYPTVMEGENGHMHYWLLLVVVGIFYGCSYLEAFIVGLTPSDWWSREQIEMVAATSCHLSAAYDVLKKVLGILEIEFQVTPKTKIKEVPHKKVATTKEDVTLRDFLVTNRKHMPFIPPTTIVLLNVVGILYWMVFCACTRKALPVIELACCVWAVVLLRKGVHSSILLCSSLLALAFVVVTCLPVN